MESQYLQQLRQKKLGLATEKPTSKPRIKPMSDKKRKQLAEEKPKRNELKVWFTDRIKEMTGRCRECGCRINKHNKVFAIMSIAHVLPKRKNMFPSVSTHSENWIELCTENGCHDRYDRSWDDASQMKIWPDVVEKFKAIYPAIAANERKHLPDILRQEVL